MLLVTPGVLSASSTVPAYPVPGQPIALRITAGSASSPVARVFPHTATVSGNDIRVEGCYVEGSFSVPGSYVASAGVPALSAGRYRVSYYRNFCDYSGRRFGELRLYSFFEFDVQDPSDAWPPSPRPVTPVVEYYHESFGHYFLTGDESEQIAVESGRFAGWEPVTSGAAWYASFPSDQFAFYQAASGLLPVCRFFSGSSFAPKSSHFYTAHPEECERVKGNPHWVFEGIVGFVAPVRNTDVCDQGVPLYRLYNDGKGGAPNHRYTTSILIHQVMQIIGWRPEGFLGCVARAP